MLVFVFTLAEITSHFSTHSELHYREIQNSCSYSSINETTMQRTFCIMLAAAAKQETKKSNQHTTGPLTDHKRLLLSTIKCQQCQQTSLKLGIGRSYSMR